LSNKSPGHREEEENGRIYFSSSYSKEREKTKKQQRIPRYVLFGLPLYIYIFKALLTQIFFSFSLIPPELS